MNNQNNNLTEPLTKKTLEIPKINSGNGIEKLPFSKVDGYSNLIRDERTKAVLNTNFNDYKNYKELKKIKDLEKSRIETLENDINLVKNDLNEIKTLLRKLANES